MSGYQNCPELIAAFTREFKKPMDSFIDSVHALYPQFTRVRLTKKGKWSIHERSRFKIPEIVLQNRYGVFDSKEIRNN